MSIDRSLRLKDALVRHRNVLTRAERILKLKDEERWEEGSSVLGLPKVAHRKSHAGKKAAKEKGSSRGIGRSRRSSTGSSWCSTCGWSRKARGRRQGGTNSGESPCGRSGKSGGSGKRSQEKIVSVSVSRISGKAGENAGLFCFAF